MRLKTENKRKTITSFFSFVFQSCSSCVVTNQHSVQLSCWLVWIEDAFAGNDSVQCKLCTEIPIRCITCFMFECFFVENWAVRGNQFRLKLFDEQAVNRHQPRIIALTECFIIALTLLFNIDAKSCGRNNTRRLNLSHSIEVVKKVWRSHHWRFNNWTWLVSIYEIQSKFRHKSDDLIACHRTASEGLMKYFIKIDFEWNNLALRFIWVWWHEIDTVEKDNLTACSDLSTFQASTAQVRCCNLLWC